MCIVLSRYGVPTLQTCFEFTQFHNKSIYPLPRDKLAEDIFHLVTLALQFWTWCLKGSSRSSVKARYSGCSIFCNFFPYHTMFSCCLSVLERKEHTWFLAELASEQFSTFTTFTCQATVGKYETARSDVIVRFGLHVWKRFKQMYGRRVAKHLLCRLVNKGLYGAGKYVYWCTDFINLAIAVHACHELGAMNYGSCCTL